MGKEKGGFLTPKAVANRIKAKGLQKLRWFCQMCQKQCRDENGFKVHATSVLSRLAKSERPARLVPCLLAVPLHVRVAPAPDGHVFRELGALHGRVL